MTVVLRPLQAPVGFAADIGDRAYDSIRPSPSQRSRSWKEALFARRVIQADPWLDKASKGPLPSRPPNHRTDERFRGKLEKYLQSLQVTPEHLGREVDRRRGMLWTGFPFRDGDDQGPFFAPAGVASIADVSASLAVRGAAAAAAAALETARAAQERPPAQRRRPDGARDAADGGAGGRSPLPRPVRCPPRCFAQDSAAPPRVSPRSPSAVPVDDGGGALPSEPRRSLGSLPRSAMGLPRAFDEASSISPPARCGWVPLPQGPWHKHPEQEHWLFEPNEGVYFHVPSDTLWREEALAPSRELTSPLSPPRSSNRSGGFAEDSEAGCVRIELAVRHACADADPDADGACSVAPAATGGGRTTGRSSGSPGLSRSTSRRSTGLSAQRLPSAGWLRVDDERRETWWRNSDCPGWLRKQEGGVYFHEASETLWQVGDVTKDACGADVIVFPIDDGFCGLPGTPCTQDGRRVEPNHGSPTCRRSCSVEYRTTPYPRERCRSAAALR